MRQQVWRDLFNRVASAALQRDYSLLGTDMQRVNAERMERLEPSPLCVV